MATLAGCVWLHWLVVCGYVGSVCAGDEPAVLDIQDCLNNGDIRRLEQLVSALR